MHLPRHRSSLSRFPLNSFEILILAFVSVLLLPWAIASAAPYCPSNYSTSELSNKVTVIADCSATGTIQIGTDLTKVNPSTDVLHNATIKFQNVSGILFRFGGYIQNLVVIIDNCTSASGFFPTAPSSVSNPNPVALPRSSFTGCSGTNITIVMKRYDIPRGIGLEESNITHLSLTAQNASMANAFPSDVYTDPLRIAYFGSGLDATDVNVTVTNIQISANAIQTAFLTVGEGAIIHGMRWVAHNVSWLILPKVINIFAILDSTVSEFVIRCTLCNLTARPTVPIAWRDIPPNNNDPIPPDLVAFVAFLNVTVVSMTVDLSGIVATGPINFFLATNRSSFIDARFSMEDAVLDFPTKIDSESGQRGFVALLSTTFAGLDLSITNAIIAIGNSTASHFIVLLSNATNISSSPRNGAALAPWRSRFFFYNVSSDDAINGGGIAVATSSAVTSTDFEFSSCSWTLVNSHFGGASAEQSELPFIVGFRYVTMTNSNIMFTNNTALKMSLLKTQSDGTSVIIAQYASFTNTTVSLFNVNALMESRSINTMATGLFSVDSSSWSGGGGLQVVDSTVVVLSQRIGSMFLATNSPFTGVTLHLLSSYVRLVATNVTSDGADASPAAILFGMTTREFVAQIAQVINVSFLVDSSNIVLQSELGHVVSVSLTTTSLLFLNHTNFENVLFDVSNGCNISSQNMLLFATPKNWLRHSFSNTTFLIRRQSSIVIRGHGPLMVAFAFFAAEFGDADRNNQIIVDNASIHLIPLIPSASPPFPTRGKGGFMCSLVTASPSYSALVRDSSVNAIDAGYVSLILRNHSTFQVQYMIDDNPTTQPNVSLKGVDFGVDPLGMLMMFTNASGTSTTDAPPGFAISGINATVTGNVLVEGGSYVNLAGGRILGLVVLVEGGSYVNLAGGRILGLVVIMALNGTATVTLQEKSRATIAPYGITAATGALVIAQNCPFVSVLAMHITTSSVVWMSITAETFGNLPCFDGCAYVNNNTTNSSSSTTIVNQKRQVSLMALLAQHSPVGLMSLTVSSQSMLNTSFFGLPTNSSEYPVNLSTVGVGLVAVISSSVVNVIAVSVTDSAAVHLDCVDCTGVLIAFAESVVTNLVELSVSSNSSTFVRVLTTTPQDQIASLDSMLTSAGVNILGLGGVMLYKTDNAGTGLQTNLLLNESSSVTIFGAVLAVVVGITSKKGHVNISATLQHHANLKVSSYGTAVGVTASQGVLADSFALVTMNSYVELSVDGAVSSGVAFQIFQAGNHLTSVLEISHFSSVFVNVSQNSSHVEGASDSSICVGGLIVVDGVANASFSFRTVTLMLLNSSQYAIEALDAVPTLVLIKDRMTSVNVDIAEESAVSVVGATTHAGVNILDLKEGGGDILYYFVGLASLMFYTKATIEREVIFAVRSASRVSLSSKTIMAFFIQDSNASAANVSILLYRDTLMNLSAFGDSTSLLNTLVLATGSNFSQLHISVSGDDNNDGGYNSSSNDGSSASQRGAQLIMTLRPTLWQGTQIANAVVFLRSQMVGGGLEFVVGNGGSFVLDAESALALVIMSMDSTVGEGSALSVRAHTNGSIVVNTTYSCLVAGNASVPTDFSGVTPKNLTGMAALILSFAGSMDGQGLKVNASSGCSVSLQGPMAAGLIVLSLSPSTSTNVAHSNNIILSINVESGAKLLVISASPGSMSFLASMMIVIGSIASGVHTSVNGAGSQLVVSAPNATSVNETNDFWLANGLKLCFGISSSSSNAVNASDNVVTYASSFTPTVLAISFFFQSSTVSSFTVGVSQLGYVNVFTRNGTALLIVAQTTVLPIKSLIIASNGTLQIRTSYSDPLSLGFGVRGASAKFSISNMPGICATELLDQGLIPTAAIINMTISSFGTLDAQCVQTFFSIVSFNSTITSSVLAGTFLIESNGSANFIAAGNPYSLNAAIFVIPGSTIQLPHIQVQGGGSLSVAVRHDIVLANASGETFFATLVLAIDSTIVDFVLQVTEGGVASLTTSNGITAAIVLVDGSLNGSTTSVDGENSIIRVVATSSGAPINFFEAGADFSSIAGVATWFFTTSSPFMTRMFLAVNNRSSVVVSAPSVGLFFVMIDGVDGAILETLDIVVSDASILQMNATSFATLVAVSNASVSSINISILNRSAIILSYDSGQPQFSPALIGVLAFSSAAVASLTFNVIHGSYMQLLSAPLSNQTAVPITSSNFDTLITAGAAVIFLVSQLGSLGAAQIIVDSVAVAGTTAIPTAITLHATLATVLGCLTCFFNQTISVVVRNPSASINVAAQGIGMLAAFQTPRRVAGVTIASSNSATLTLSLPSSSSVTNTNNKLAAFLVFGSSEIGVNGIVNVSNLWLLLDTTSVITITCTRCTLGGLVASGKDIVVVNMTVRVRGASKLNLLCTVPLLTAEMTALLAGLSGGFTPALLNQFSTNSIAAVVALLSSVTVRDFHFQVYQRGSTLHATGAVSAVMLAFGATLEGAQCDVYDFGAVVLESGQGYGFALASTFLFFGASATVDRVAINVNSANITTFATLGYTASLVYFEGAVLVSQFATPSSNTAPLFVSLQNGSCVSLKHQETSIFGQAIPSFLHFLYINSGAMSTSSSLSSSITVPSTVFVAIDGNSSVVLSIPTATGILCGFMYLSKSTGVSMSLFLGGNSSITTPTLSSSTQAQTATTMSFIVRVGASSNFSGSNFQVRGRVSLLPGGSIVEFANLGSNALPRSSNSHVSVGLIDPIIEWVSTSTSTSGIGSALIRVSGNGAVLQGATIEIRNLTRFNMSNLGSGGGVVAIDASGITTSTTTGIFGGSITLADSIVSSSESAPLIAVRSSSSTANGSTVHVNLTRNQLYYTSRSSSLLQSRLSAAGPLMFLEPARSATITASQQRAFDILLDDNNFARYANLFDARSNLTFPDLIETHCTTFITGRGWVKYTITPVS
ncbi:membrane-associated protein, putative [Bodo saltans]|uniref:Membrane-associated protein, putative n=1 Tax=Bodo saltans TaxID=75058 RepID=A0A0S4JA78_BODSA|nr:membrane-associated protein, putative [Bodo saltans]|eukprot:CUG87024.1 membrane-associated protein, putative [Bodo saltans]